MVQEEDIFEIHHHKPLVFPKGFLWGAATSAHQVEGGNTRNDWHEWEKQGHVHNGELSGNAADQFNRYKEDATLAENLGYNSQRISLEWSRIEPEPGVWDKEAIAHYREVLSDIRSHNMKTMLTIWHFTLPQWFAKRGGWLSRDAVARFLAFVEVVATELGDLVDYWIVVNEPTVYVAQGYLNGVWPPGRKDQRWQAFRIFRKLVKAQRRAYVIIHRLCDRVNYRTQVGTANNIFTFELYRRHSIGDSFYLWLADNIINHQYIWWTRNHIDFVGVNYYFHHRFLRRPKHLSEMVVQQHVEKREVSDVGWEISPTTIFAAIMDVSRYNKPIIITENGIASADDSKRARTIIATIKELWHAIEAGVDIRGYFHWSLIDNFEWEKGFSPRFGLIEINYETQARTPRHSAEIYGEIARENALNHELLRYLGHGIK